MSFTEDEVRKKASEVLGLKNEGGIKADVGQLTTFKKVGIYRKKQQPQTRWLASTRKKHRDSNGLGV